jgi:hypothetical protein
MIEAMATVEESYEEGRTQVARPWPVTFIGLLLLFQSAGLLALALYTLAWPLQLAQVIAEQPSAVAALVFAFLAPFALWASIGFLRRWRNAWLNAMLLQGLCLLMALTLYISQEKPAFAYVVMAFSVYLVIYLNHYEVKEAFRTRAAFEEGE